jgi:hypothetical protein
MASGILMKMRNKAFNDGIDALRIEIIKRMEVETDQFGNEIITINNFDLDDATFAARKCNETVEKRIRKP